MNDTPKTRPTDPWARYAPSVQAPWDLQRVVHLHRRAGFAATWDEIQRDLKEGPQASVERLLQGRSRSYGVPPNFEPISVALGEAAAASRDPARLKAWWLYRMLFGPDPLGERLTLFWHNHFATSNLKVDDLALMQRQNEVFRQFARASFRKLLPAVVRDPAVLLWLDAQANRKGHPNENLARELMELFTLGIGHYTESDVKESARALTGWTVVDGEFQELPTKHDPGPKTILGKKGAWKGDDLVGILLEHPATAERLATKLCGLFLTEKVIDPAARRVLAEGLRQHDLDIGWAVETILRSEAFFAGADLRGQVLGPVEFVVGSVRALEMLDAPASTLVLAEWTARLGQDLFYPPNVGGWNGGRSWITTRSVIGRANFAAALMEGKTLGRPEAFDAVGLARRHGRPADPAELVLFYGELFTGTQPSGAWRDRVLASADKGDSGRLVALMLASPEAQLA
jgi:uncharacterized protein (DUF1800 family)